MNEPYPAPLFDTLAFATRAADEIGDIPGLESPDDKVEANRIIFEELHQWSAQHMPMGASMSEADHEQMIRRGLNAVRTKIGKCPDARLAYGIDPITLITLVASLLSIARTIMSWWRGQ